VDSHLLTGACSKAWFVRAMDGWEHIGAAYSRAGFGNGTFAAHAHAESIGQHGLFAARLRTISRAYMPKWKLGLTRVAC